MSMITLLGREHAAGQHAQQSGMGSLPTQAR